MMMVMSSFSHSILKVLNKLYQLYPFYQMKQPLFNHNEKQIKKLPTRWKTNELININEIICNDSRRSQAKLRNKRFSSLNIM
jgi:hypothetical protein